MTYLRQGQSSTLNKSPNTTCQICYKEDHLASNCKKLTQFSEQSYNKTGWGTEILICQICKKREHSADKHRFCDHQARRSVNIENYLICQLCSKSDHNAKSCGINNQNKHSTINGATN